MKNYKKEKIYKNKWIEVFEDKVIRPDNKKSIYGTVRMKGGVGVIAVDDDNFVYLTKEFRYAIARATLDLVTSGVNKKETPLAAAK